ncbi:MAG: von Willebrand factor type A domain-containing protein [Chitinophagales bacterium]
MMKNMQLLFLAGLLSATALIGVPSKTNYFSIVKSGDATISGIVCDAAIGNTLNNVEIKIDKTNLKTATDTAGKFTFTNLSEGSYTIKVNAKGYVQMDTAVRVTPKQNLNLQIHLKAKTPELLSAEQDKTEAKTYTPSAVQMDQYTVKQSNLTSRAVMYSIGEDFYNANFHTEDYSVISENGFKKVLGNPLSTFSIDVDNASYSIIRRFIANGQNPPKDAVRIEEMINYFDYNYPQPAGETPFEIYTELSDCPWNKESKLLLIGLQGKEMDYNKTDPSNLVFLIDVSGSMSAENKLPLVKKSLMHLVENLSEKDRIAIVVYAGAAGLVLPSTPASDIQKIYDALNKLQYGGSTAGGAGIALAYNTALENFIEGGNNRVILCTDGDFNVGASGNSEMVRLIEEKRKCGVFLTICGFGMGNYKDAKMEGIANNGNGNYYYIDTEKEAKKVFVTDMRGTLFTIAKDVKIQIEFNPAKVAEYRLIGYENRLLNKEDFDNDAKDAGELGAGHRVTAMYELILKDNKQFSPQGIAVNGEDLKYQSTTVKENAYFSSEIMTLKLRYKKPDSDVSKLIETSVTETHQPLAQSSDNFRFAASVAEFGMLLRDSEFKGSATYEDVVKLANSAKGADSEGYRSEFISMVQTFIHFAQAK